MATKRSKMPISERAKQFMPFAAVTGLDAALAEVENRWAKIDRPEIPEERMQEMLTKVVPGNEVMVTFYQDGSLKDIKGKIIKADNDSFYIEYIEIPYGDLIDIE